MAVRRRRGVAERISEAVVRQVSNGRLAVGDRLPSEREMARRYDVSRGSVREAYRALQARGIVTVKRGAYGGAVVAAASVTADPASVLAALLALTNAVAELTEATLANRRRNAA